MTVQEGDLLWEPSEQFKNSSNVSKFINWLQHNKKCHVKDYTELWQWSIDNVEDFWEALWQFFEVQSSTPYTTVLGEKKMPGTEWFSGSKVNYAQHLLRNEIPSVTVLHSYSELYAPRKVSWDELSTQVKILAQQMRAMGIKSGDRVACYMPNIPEAVIAMIASASIGAIFSSCSPDFGFKSVIDRFSQIEPKLFFCVDGYRYGGQDFDRRAEVKKIISELPTVDNVIHLPYLFQNESEKPTGSSKVWADVLDDNVSIDDFIFSDVPFDHPLWIVYSSGTTGLPKPIVHSHGGITLEFMKLLSFHMDLDEKSTMFFFSSTGWVMWNIVIGSLITGSAAVLYDGNPASANDPNILWRLAEETGTTFFGTSPTFISLMENQGIVPNELYDLSAIEGILLGGSPATPEAMKWCYDNIKTDLWVTSQSGGTDICSGFVGASPTLPVYAGEIQTRCLGVDAQAFNDEGKSVINEVGELVILKPMPSMPIYFWNDKNGERYLSSYFDDYPSIWRHGDYFKVNDRGGCYILGRSDSTLNRYGVRIGTAEIYRTVEKLEEVVDSIIVNLDLAKGKFFMPLFVKLKEGEVLSEELCQSISKKLRAECSPRHVPDKIITVDEIPYTLTNKKMEIPLRKILLGMNPNKAASRDSMANPSSLDFYINYAENTDDINNV